ncbi:MAG: acyltransferase family protein [Candidatus Hodarchaeales archaeon]|jgi:hypothetical protein
MNANTNSNTVRKSFYLATVDILQGVSIFLMIIGHVMLWWDPTTDSRWPDINFPAALTIAIALPAHPGFLFIYGFNVVNSLLRKEKSERSETRFRLLKRTIIFFLIAEFCEGSAALVNRPELLLNFLLTWELFHMFALSTLFLLLVFEFAWWIEKQGNIDYKRVITALLSSFLLLTVLFFLLFHDYTNRVGIQNVYVNLDINSILQRALFEYGQNPVIPFFSFPILGGLLASFLDLPHERKNIVLKKAGVILIGGISALITGIMFLGIERYVSTPMLYPASSSFVLITIGILSITTILLILFIDLKLLHSSQTVNKIFLPIILISKISLTIYIIHNVAFVIPAKSPIVRVFIPSEIAIIVFGIFYSLFFVLVAYFWQKRKFKYSLEWMIYKLQSAQWRWWVNKPADSPV